MFCYKLKCNTLETDAASLKCPFQLQRPRNRRQNSAKRIGLTTWMEFTDFRVKLVNCRRIAFKKPVESHRLTSVGLLVATQGAIHKLNDRPL